MSISSKRWLDEHFSDYYVKRAKAEGYVCRAAYKLLELNTKDPILKKGMTVVDLGAAPGGWSQVAVKLVGQKGRVIALDLLPMKYTGAVEYLQGDFSEDECLEQLMQILKGDPVDVVLSDMSPNMSGVKSVDQPVSVYLLELALDFALQVLNPGGHFVAKVFQGQGVEALVKVLKTHFKTVKQRKPPASRPRSAEIYLLGLDFKEN